MGKSARAKSLTFIVFVLVLLAAILFLRTFEASATSQAIIINEVVYDPDGTDLGYEWIELKNISDEIVSIKDWTIEVAGSSFTQAITIPDISVNPGSLLLIAEKNVQNADLSVEKIAMQNGGSETDSVRIVDYNGNVMDTLLYDSPNVNNLTDDTGNTGESFAIDVASGHSLCRVNSSDTDKAETDFRDCEVPSPGEENTFAPNAIFTIEEPTFTNKELELDGSSSYDIDGTIESYCWNIQPGDKKLTGEKIIHIFTTEDVYTVTLEIVDNSGIKTSTTQEIEILNDPDNPTTIPISKVKTLDKGTTVSIKGTITAKPGLLYTAEGYIQDETGGIRIKTDGKVKLEQDKTYIITGKIDSAYEEPRINVSTIIAKEEIVKISPVLINDFSKIPNNIGLLVEIVGKVQRKVSNNLYISDGSQEARINISNYTGIEVPEGITDKEVKITGIVSQYGLDEEGNPKVKILPRHQDDIILSDGTVLATTGVENLYLVIILLLLAPITFFYVSRKG